jgi:hypothetical protein
MNIIILLIILVALLCLTIGPAFAVPITRGFWVVIFIALVVALILVLIPLAGSFGGVK